MLQSVDPLNIDPLETNKNAIANKVNLAKSELVPVGNVDNVDGLIGILGCEVSSLPLKYLGLLLGASSKAKSA